MAENKIPVRSEVPEEYTWNTADIYPSDEAWQAECDALRACPARISAFAGTLGESAAKLLAFLQLDDELSQRIGRLYGYAMLKSDEDVGNSFYQDMRGKAMGVAVAVSSASAFMTPEVMAIDDEKLEGFYKAEPKLETYRRVLYGIRRRKAHILSSEGSRPRRRWPSRRRPSARSCEMLSCASRRSSTDRAFPIR